MRKKGFTLIELLVVIAIIAMLLAILMPALGAVKKLAQRLICGTNLKGIGTAQFTYAIDNEEEFARQGAGRGNNGFNWNATTLNWKDLDVDWQTQTGGISVGASLYLLVRDVDTEPEMFKCPSSEQKRYEGQGINDDDIDLLEVWDFGNSTVAGAENYGPENCVSYSYQLPYKTGGRPARPADSTASASYAFMADKNPWFDPALSKQDTSTTGLANTKINRDSWETIVALLTVDWGTTSTVRSWQQKAANSEAHQREGQNVLFGDGHVDFEKRADVAMQNDNIYTVMQGGAAPWTETQRRVGGAQSNVGSGDAKNKADTWLVNDDEF